RCEQDSNLRGKTPLDFKSNALTTRPSQLIHSPSHKMILKSLRLDDLPLLGNFEPTHLHESAKRKLRCEQDSNLRGDTPLDFESNALTTRPSQRRPAKSKQCFLLRKKVRKKYSRCEQDSNLRGETPLDFKSNALTTR
ncbi:unnamed protein product, partial [Porites lobata]